MKKKIHEWYQAFPLAQKIRFSYLLLVIPLLVLLIISSYTVFQANRRNEEMIESAVVASNFSMDFKDDFDYETYLLIIGNKSVEQSGLDDLLTEANEVVDELENLTSSYDNHKRLISAKKYLTNLSTYKGRIIENLIEGNMYEDNIEIWENDIQIVTSLLEETVSEYIYYEIRELQNAKNEYRIFFTRMVVITSAATIAVLILLVFLSIYIPAGITKPIERLSEVTNQVAKGDLSIRSDVEAGGEVKVLSDSFNQMIDKIDELIEQVTTERIRLKDAELELLQAQINPHFLYNTLDTITWLAEDGKTNEVKAMVKSLSDFFRTSLNNGKDIISIEEEMLHVRSYLQIQKVRYMDILEYEIDVPDDIYEYRIPKISIQPLVENALYHGIKNKRGLGHIRVTGERVDDEIVLEVLDDGIGIMPERLEMIKRGIDEKAPEENDIYGLHNVDERIKLKFGRQYGLKIDSTYGEGTSVKVFLPTSGR